MADADAIAGRPATPTAEAFPEPAALFGEPAETVTPEYRVGWSDVSCFWVAGSTSEAECFPRTITDDEPIVFTVEPVDGAIDWIAVRFATWQRRNTPDVVAELYDPAGRPLCRTVIGAADIGDGAFIEIADLRSAPIDGNQTLTVRLSSVGATHDDGFAVWMRDEPLRDHGRSIQIENLRSERFFVYGCGDRSRRSAETTRVLLLVSGCRDDEVRAALSEIAGGLPGASVIVTHFQSVAEVWPVMQGTAAVFFLGEPPDFDAICFALHRCGIGSVFVDFGVLDGSAIRPSQQLRGDFRLRDGARRCCAFTLSHGRLIDNASGRPGLSSADYIEWPVLFRRARERRHPPVSLILRASDHNEQTQAWAGRCAAQPYPGAVDIVVVGAGRSCDLASAIEGSWPGKRSICAAADGKAAAAHIAGVASDDRLVVLTDGGEWEDTFLAAHVFEHFDGQAAIVMGRSTYDDEEQPDPLDSIQLDGFLNCTSSNVSFPSKLVERLSSLIDCLGIDDAMSRRARELESAFDAYAGGVAFRSSTKAELRLRRRIPDDCADSALTTIAETTRPELRLVARRRLLRVTEGAARSRSRPRRPLNILTYRWHVPHQYELYKLPHRFTLATEIGENRFVDGWSFDQRPLPENVKFAPAESIDVSDYDLAILHFDEHVMATYLSNGALHPSWGDPFDWGLGLDLPKIAVCHGTPPFVGQFAARQGPIVDFQIHEPDRERLVKAAAAADLRVVCNSHQALDEWGFQNARVIWHGFDPQEWPPATYRNGVLAPPLDWQRPHYRGVYEAEQVLSMLGDHVPVGRLRYDPPPMEIRQSNAYAAKMLRSYIDATRGFSVFLNTTRRSPMPRTRGEAMMMGVAPVCLRNHDVELFIDSGSNGFFADDPDELADFLNHLFRDDERVRRLGAAARRTALDLFNHDLYLSEWTTLIDELT